MWLAETVTPLFVLDQQRKVLFFNRGCEQLSGWDAGDVIGQVCDYVSEPDHEQIESLTGSLCPPPEVLEGSETHVPTFFVDRSGQKQARMTRFVPLDQGDGSIDRILGIVSPLSPTTSAASSPPDRQLHAELASIRADLRRRYDVTTLVGQSAIFRRMLRQVEVARRSVVNVHFVGETGTGCEHLARLLHYQGPSKRHAFVPVDCARLTSDELASTLADVLNDAAETESSHLRPGTLFLKNVDRLPADLQRLIVDHWGDDESPSSLRLTSESLRPLSEAVDCDAMGDDCFQLLSSLVVSVPPLRERMDDFPLIAQDMLERDNRDRESQVAGFAEEVWSLFRRYRWPGNQRELQAVVQEARARCTGKLIVAADLPFRFRTGREAQQIRPRSAPAFVTLERRLADVEREHIRNALEASGNNKSRAAEQLGITRPRLYRRIQELGLSEASDET